MDTTVENITGLLEPDRKLTLQIPVDLRDWAHRHEPRISILSQSIKGTSTPLTENAVWHRIAEAFSGEWKDKHTELQRTEKRLAHLNAPENMPLGLVGAALHSDEINDATDKHTLALVDFTIVNEDLRQQRELHTLLGALLHYQQTVTQSMHVSRDVAAASDQLDLVAGITPEAGKAFGKTAAKKPEKAGLSLSFKSFAAKLLRKPGAQPAPKSKGNTLGL
jgi:hypothetical protein